MKTAIILFNLGAPDRLEAVKPFLFNLFNDPAIIKIPNPMRWCLAKLISSKREKFAQENYKLMGGSSPLLKNTQKQADLLKKEFDDQTKIFIAMRYYHPYVSEAVDEVIKFNPDQVILVPLYPQFSTSTTGSSFKEWKNQARKKGLNKKTYSLCCYPTEDGFVQTNIDNISKELDQLDNYKDYRLLFSAHGIPKKFVEAGDSYQYQVEQSSKVIAKELEKKYPVLDWVVCYQSRVGPLEWIKPYIDDEIKRAADERKSLLIVPIAFVSEHLETLVELDIEFKEMAKGLNIKDYRRISTAGDHKAFIKGLAQSIKNLLKSEPKINSNQLKKLCPSDFKQCPCWSEK